MAKCTLLLYNQSKGKILSNNLSVLAEKKLSHKDKMVLWKLNHILKLMQDFLSHIIEICSELK